MMTPISTPSEAEQPTAEIPAEVLDWIRQHASLTELCQIGGWPDDAGMRVELSRHEPKRWIVNLYFDEVIMEISECEVTRRERCGQYAVDLDDAGHAVAIRLLYPL
jgi:hypothetical protein